ncbi:hypothetical protein D3C73_1510240 [compost metagenome]
MVHSDHIESALLIKADCARVIVRRNQPHFGTAQRSRRQDDQLNQLRTCAEILQPAVQRDNLTFPGFAAIIDDSLYNAVLHRTESG